MPNNLIINQKIRNFDKKIEVDGDKSLSIRWILLSSLASAKSTAQNLLLSEDVMAAINTIRKLGIKVIIKDKTCAVYGRGLEGYRYKKTLLLMPKIREHLEDLF